MTAAPTALAIMLIIPTGVASPRPVPLQANSQPSSNETKITGTFTNPSKATVTIVAVLLLIKIQNSTRTTSEKKATSQFDLSKLNSNFACITDNITDPRMPEALSIVPSKETELSPKG